jgi:hypothetical protein
MKELLDAAFSMPSVSFQILSNSACHLLACWFCCTYFFDPDDGSDMFLRNFG